MGFNVYNCQNTVKVLTDYIDIISDIFDYRVYRVDPFLDKFFVILAPEVRFTGHVFLKTEHNDIRERLIIKLEKIVDDIFVFEGF